MSHIIYGNMYRPSYCHLRVTIGKKWIHWRILCFVCRASYRKSKPNQQMHKIIGKNKIYIQPLHMFRQIDCYLHGVYIRELQVLCEFKYAITFSK
jgi:hypothetical protein